MLPKFYPTYLETKSEYSLYIGNLFMTNALENIVYKMMEIFSSFNSLRLGDGYKCQLAIP